MTLAGEDDLFFAEVDLFPDDYYQPLNGYRPWRHRTLAWVDENNQYVSQLVLTSVDNDTVIRVVDIREMPLRLEGEGCDPKRLANVCEDGLRCVAVGEGHECQMANAPVLESARLLGARNGIVDLIEVRGTDVDRDAAMIRYRFFGQAGNEFLLMSQDVKQGFDRVTYDGDQFVAQVLFPEILLDDLDGLISMEVVDTAGLVSETLQICSRCDAQAEEFFVGMAQQGEICTHYYNNLNGGCANGTRCWDSDGDGISQCEDIDDIEILEVSGWYNADQNRLLVESRVQEPLGGLREIRVWVGFEGTPGDRVVFDGSEFMQRREGEIIIFEKVLTEEEFEGSGVPERMSVEVEGFDQKKPNLPDLEEVMVVATPEVQDMANEECDPEALRNRCPAGTACLPNDADVEAGPRCQPAP